MDPDAIRPWSPQMFEYCAARAGGPVEAMLNFKAGEGWRFVAFDGDLYIFERRVGP